MHDVAEAESALQTKFGHSSQNSAVEMKNATMPDTEIEVADAFIDKRPLLVLDEGKTEGVLPSEAVLKYSLDSSAEIQVPASHEFDDQYVCDHSSCEQGMHFTFRQ